MNPSAKKPVYWLVAALTAAMAIQVLLVWFHSEPYPSTLYRVFSVPINAKSDGGKIETAAYRCWAISESGEEIKLKLHELFGSARASASHSLMETIWFKSERNSDWPPEEPGRYEFRNRVWSCFYSEDESEDYRVFVDWIFSNVESRLNRSDIVQVHLAKERRSLVEENGRYRKEAAIIGVIELAKGGPDEG